MVIWTTQHWSRESVANDTEHYYVFGDNTEKYGNAGQACIRGLPNAFGVPTKVSPDMGPSAFFTDDDETGLATHLQKKLILRAIKRIPTDKPIVVSVDIGRGLAELHIRAPQTWAFLISELNKL